jgi:hypothetical protein
MTDQSIIEDASRREFEAWYKKMYPKVDSLVHKNEMLGCWQASRQSSQSEPVTKETAVKVGKETGLIDWASEDNEFFTFVDDHEISGKLVKFANHFLAAPQQAIPSGKIQGYLLYGDYIDAKRMEELNIDWKACGAIPLSASPTAPIESDK